jgi:glycosyltransferase involved in cell wall biosynthesis
MTKKIYIISNESIYTENGNYFCDNIDIKSIPEALNKYSEVSILARKSKIQRSKKIDIKNIYIYGSIFFFIASLIKSFNTENKYLIVSISPYTFLSVLVLMIFRKKNYVYLRSDGYQEYKSILGFYGPVIYHIMFSLTAKISFLISCRKHILRNKPGKIVHPSHLNDSWFSNYQEADSSEVKLLYVGRIRVEKGVFSLLEILNKLKIGLTIVNSETDNTIKKKYPSINVISFSNYNDSIIKFYDSHNILILPSFTEGHPQVLDEALARHRPVIIFQEIEHVIRDRKGVFACDRDASSLSDKINYILKNYQIIQDEIKKNSLPTKENFINEIKKIIFEE